MQSRYTFFITVIFTALAFQSNSQANFPSLSSIPLPSTTNEAKAPPHFSKAETDLEIFWSEDFSNGVAGQDSNGAWTTSGAQGTLWFQTFPVDAVNGYHADSVILGGTHPEYGIKLPVYFSPLNSDACNSETRDNGVMMIDADRWNSTRTIDNPDGEMTDDTLDAILMSPIIDLTGAEHANLIFNQRLWLCCGQYNVSVDLSIDGGDSWESYDAYGPGGGGVAIENQPIWDISEILQGAADLSNCRVRFKWDGDQTHFYWFVDDIHIVSLPDNDLVAGKTFTNDYFLKENSVFADVNPTPASEYFAGFEYAVQPEYFAHPFNFGMEVENAGRLTQTDVMLRVIWTAPSGTTDTLYSESVTIEPEGMDTLQIPNISHESLGLEVGQYNFDFSVSQAEPEEVPGDNIGSTRNSIISNESDNSGYTIMQNTTISPTNLSYHSLSEDVIWATTYVFPELHDAQAGYPKAITHIEAVFMFAENVAETMAGSVIYFNVRKGHPLYDDPDNPSDLSTVMFGDDNLTYDEQELEFEITESEIWNYQTDESYIWSSFQLPYSILVEQGVVYSAEYRIPAGSLQAVHSPAENGSEKYASLIYSFEDEAWYPLGNNATNTGNVMAIRLRTSDPIGIDEITVGNGLTLVQNYPNPFTTVTKIQYSVDHAGDLEFEVHDITGKLVFSEDLGTVPTNMPQTYEFQKGKLAPGIYTYTIRSAEKSISRKLTVN